MFKKLRELLEQRRAQKEEREAQLDANFIAALDKYISRTKIPADDLSLARKKAAYICLYGSREKLYTAFRAIRRHEAREREKDGLS
jgi:hypothetical protein